MRLSGCLLRRRRHRRSFRSFVLILGRIRNTINFTVMLVASAPLSNLSSRWPSCLGRKLFQTTAYRRSATCASASQREFASVTSAAHIRWRCRPASARGSRGRAYVIGPLCYETEESFRGILPCCCMLTGSVLSLLRYCVGSLTHESS